MRLSSNMSPKDVGLKFKYLNTPNPNTKNYEQFPAWEKTAEDMFTQFLVSEMFGNTFYATEEERLKLGIGVVDAFTKAEPKRAAEITKEARNKYFMRTVPILATVYLSKYLDKEDFDELFKTVVRTPRDAIQFIDLCRSGVARQGLGRKIKRNLNTVLANWLQYKGEFYATKYKNQLELIAKLSHPKSESPILDYVFDKKINLEQFPMIAAYKFLTRERATIAEHDIIDAIKKYRLDWNTLKGSFPNPSANLWQAWMDNMSAIALIKNIASSERRLKDPDRVLDYLKANLTIEKLNKGKVLPLRLMQAYRMSSYPDTKRFLGMLVNEYSKQYDLSNLGFVAICPDISGSMKGESNGKFSYAELAGMFAGILARACKTSCMIPWDTNIYAHQFLQEDAKWRDVVYMYNYCVGVYGGGGTNMDLPIRYLLERRIKIDTFVLLTDTEEWAGRGWLKWWQEYLKRINPNAKAFLIRADGYITHQPYPPETAMRDHIYQMMGYSDQVFKIMSMI